MVDGQRAGLVRILAGGAILAGIAFSLSRLAAAGLVLRLVEYVRDAGVAGVLVFAVAYVAATVSLLPGALLTLGAGFLWGPVLGLLIVSPVSVVAASAAFLLGRTLARGWIAAKMADSPRFAAVDRAVEREGFRVVFLLRLSPLFPFNLLNYALGLTSVRARDYVVASWIGMIPGTFLYVYLGSLITSASELLSGERPPAAGPVGATLYWVGLGATILVVVLVTRTARRALSRSLDDRPASRAERE